MVQKRRRKSYEELVFTDDFMFCKVMLEYPELCKELAELILDIKIDEIVSIDEQHPIKMTPDGRGVRFDIRMKDNQNSIYDIEMQTTLPACIEKRSRYYQGMIDLESLESGKSYSSLPNSYIIFICLVNPFPTANLHKYSFTMTCGEKSNLENDYGIKHVVIRDFIPHQKKDYPSHYQKVRCSLI